MSWRERKGANWSNQENLTSPGAMLTSLAFHAPPLRAQVVASAAAKQGKTVVLGSAGSP